MIYLNPEVKSGLGEDTFWTWFNREIESEFLTPNTEITKKDVILHYSTMDTTISYNNSICLLWELYPEMKEILKKDIWNEKIEKIERAKNSSKYKVVASKIMIPYYGDDVDVLPIGIDCDLFKPLENSSVLKQKHGIPLNRKIGIWGGTYDEMKGFDKFLAYKSENPDIYWIVIWKTPSSKPRNVKLDNCSQFIKVPQQQLNELFNCGDFFLSSSRLRPFYMIEWEAMASNLPMIILDGVEKDFVPSDNPREQILKLGWDRKTAKNTWINYINKVIESND